MYRLQLPEQPLSRYIDCFWLGDDDDLPCKPNTHHAIASSKPELLFFTTGIYAYRDKHGEYDHVHQAGFYGQTTSFNHYVAAAARTTIFGIRFKPLALPVFFNMPADEITHQRVSADTLLGRTGAELTEKILEAVGFEEKVRVATDFLTSRLKALHPKFESTARAFECIQSDQPFSISQLLAASCLSQRQFERNFKALTGFSVRTYHKLHRFERVIQLLHQSPAVTKKNLLDIALRSGYYDQAHFNHHFKEFTGLSPTAYFFNMLPVE